jgi:hypothetical protein
MTTAILIVTTDKHAARIKETAPKTAWSSSIAFDEAMVDYPESARLLGADLGGMIYLQRSGQIEQPSTFEIPKDEPEAA